MHGHRNLNFDFSSASENVLKCGLKTSISYKKATDIYDAPNMSERTALLSPSIFYYLP